MFILLNQIYLRDCIPKTISFSCVVYWAMCKLLFAFWYTKFWSGAALCWALNTPQDRLHSLKFQKEKMISFQKLQVSGLWLSCPLFPRPHSNGQGYLLIAKYLPGIVPSSVVLTAFQVMSRVFLTWAVTHSVKEVSYATKQIAEINDPSWKAFVDCWLSCKRLLLFHTV